jgi:hypothetical protein
MVRLHYTCRSFMSRRSCIEASDANKTRRPRRPIAGAIFCRFFGVLEPRVRDINNPDAVN